MRVLYICADVDIPVLGDEGSSIHIREFTNALVELGHEVDVFAAWLGDGSDSRCKAHIRAIRPGDVAGLFWRTLEREPALSGSYVDRDVKSVLVNAWLQEQGREFIESHRPDFIYERYSLFGWSGLALSRRYGLPLILEFNSPLRQEQEGYERFVFMNTAAEVERVVPRSATHSVAVSSVVAEWVQGLGVTADAVTVIRNGVSLEQFTELPSGELVRCELDLAHRRIVGFVGTFQRWHDTEGLIRAFAGIKKEISDAHLVMVGAGDGSDAVMRLAANLGLSSSVTLVGRVPHGRVAEYMAAMDVVVAPYARWVEPFYGSPVKLFEYMAAARPIVAASLGQIAEVLEHGRTGWLYTPGDEQALTDGLRQLLSDPRTAFAMGLAAREKALREHTWRAAASRVIGIAESSLGRSLFGSKSGDAATD